MRKGMVSVVSTVGGIILGGVAVGKKTNKEVEKWKNYSDKHLQIMKLYDQWMATKQDNRTLADYFEKNDIKTVAIYGMSFVGERLYNELKGTNIEVKYGIDKNLDNIYADIEIISPEDSLVEVDAIIVTAIYYFDEIEEKLSKVTNIPILSLEDILYEI